jgi:hypothetical protein
LGGRLVLGGVLEAVVVIVEGAAVIVVPGAVIVAPGAVTVMVGGAVVVLAQPVTTRTRVRMTTRGMNNLFITTSYIFMSGRFQQ